MKKDDFDMIDLDDTANWSKLDIEEKLEREEAESIREEQFMMETGRMDEVDYLDDEPEEEMVRKKSPSKKTVSKKKKPVSKKAATSKKKSSKKVAAKPVKKSSEKVAAKPVHKKKRRKPQEEANIFDRIAYSLSHMGTMDKLVAATGALVLVVAIVTLSVYSSAKAAESQIAAMAPI